MQDVVFETERLEVVAAESLEAHAAMFERLWKDPRVMANVGFPHGLPITRPEIMARLEAQSRRYASPLDRLLVARRKASGELLGECRLGTPDGEGVSETDVKLLPEHWGQGYGVEIKRGLLRYLFEHTACQAVQATPNVNNPASIRMQEAVGGRRVGEVRHEFPAGMQDWTAPVQAFVYQVRREDWQAQHK